MELYLLNFEVTRALADRGVQVARVFVGNFMTSIDMAGASVSLLRLDDQLKALLDAPCDAPALKITGPVPPVPFRDFTQDSGGGAQVTYAVETPAEHAVVGDALTLGNLEYIVDVMSETIIRNEVPFCELDSFAGDGDFGMSVAKGFKQLKREWKSITAQPNLDLSGFLNACSLVIMEHCGGASGPIWGSAFRAAARRSAGKEALTSQDCAELLQAAVAGVQDIGRRSLGRGAVVGDKTLIDALAPCADVWTEAAGSGRGLLACFRMGAEAAVLGAKRTEDIVARMGRAGTVGARSLGHPDAGAHALGVVFTAVSEALRRG